MSFEEALALYLYWMHAPPDVRDEKLFSEAWELICASAETTIRRRKE